ncbi:biopolymer transporter ExbB [Caballeronia mineralivorans PML1(12)]|uniref:Biopolymer transporter ExbB n=1 Tax=Caballeronia mineralivorans PML1(12) TaxID=908627 RepID=A0A0J1CWV6_9BURK|nr:MotA/TolQ/ExbB proton channel family protein [Caballeronia mineralivorans]KLU24856.1 biopolymer transporter ExbB [Caballeronia mineralivorans PML1(12)]
MTVKRALFLLLTAAFMCLPGVANAWWQNDWSYRKAITIDTTPKGANITESAGRVPLLIRLHPGNFQFDGLQDNGADIRFIAADDKTPLNYHVEQYDAVLGVALVWVDVPQFPAGAAQSVWMYYGNNKAPEGGKAADTFDPDYTLVYHFNGASGTPPKDLTAYGNNAQNAPARIVEDGIVGKAAQFNGTGPLNLPASPSLNVSAGGSFTFSVWVKPGALAPQTLLYSRRDSANALLIGLDNGVPFAEVDGAAGGANSPGPVRTPAGQPVAANQWTHIAVTADGKNITLYVGGKQYAQVAATLPALTSAAAVGGDVAGAPAGFTGFTGVLDELRLSKVARPAALIALDAMSQGAESKLVAYGADEKQSGFGFGYFGVIVKSVTVDAWVVIGILLVMAAISWVVMWNKAAYVGTVDKANGLFVRRFREVAGKHLVGLAHTDEKSEEGRRLRQSSMYRLYRAGVAEIHSRVDGNGRTVITAESIEAIRATMDATLVRENQRLSKSMVVLTIAISGGPFLGLLGTVVGVMITFAAIAAAGDVNVNAIAPGIAAALLATVTGLFVAIPALFGYNYLLIRNKNVTANMQVFVDEFVTRLAEAHRNPDHALAAD